MADPGAFLPETPAQALLKLLQTDFDVQQGETDMLVLAMPDMPPQQSVVVVAQAQAKLPSQKNLDGTIGVCMLWFNPGTLDPEEAKRGFSNLEIRGHAFSLYSQGPGVDPSLDADYEKAIVTILQSPKHGTLGQGQEIASQLIYVPSNDLTYFPNPNFAGNDKAVFLVNIEGHLVKVVYYFKVVRGVYDPKMRDTFRGEECPSPGWWKISLNPAPDYTQDIQPLLTYTGITGSVAVNIADLPGTTVAQTTGEH